MQILITHGSLARTRVLRVSRWQLGAALAALGLLLMLGSGLVYHVVLVKAVRGGWPIVSPLLGPLVHGEAAERDRYLRENLDAMAQKVGDLQAKLIRLEMMGEQVSGVMGVRPDELKPLLKPAPRGGQGGPFVAYPGPPATTMERLNTLISALDAEADRHTDVFTLLESRQLEARLKSLMVPNSAPLDGPVGSGFGFRLDPFTGRAALHTGLDFVAEVGSPVRAAAGGVVASSEFHPEYGKLVQIDHGNGLTTRYAHNSKVFVKAGDLVHRGQIISQVGTTGRSTGAHLHFEVLVDGVPQDPATFLSGVSPSAPAARTARAPP